MKPRSITTVSIAIVLILSACGAQTAAIPTTNPLDVQSTAVAAAFTIVAQTQAAIPTATPLPPTTAVTATALPTDTPLSLPSAQVSAAQATFTPAAVSTNSSGGDPCKTRTLSSPNGASTIIRIANTTKANVTISLYLNEAAGKGVCGWRTYQLGKNGDVVITDLIQGCYNLWAWSDDTKLHFNVASGTSCINSPQKWTFFISSSTIKLTF